MGLQLLFRAIFSIDFRALAAFRIGLASLILVDLLLRSSDLTAFYSDEGVLPRKEWLSLYHQWRISLHVANGSTIFQAGLFLVHASFASLMLVGRHTRIATFVSWLLLLSLQARNPMICNGGDSVLMLLTFWGVFLQLGNRWSLDSILASNANESHARHPARTISAVSSDMARTSNSLCCNVATVALFMQIVLMYITTGLLKAQAPAWWNGEAISISLNIDSTVTSFGQRLLEMPTFLQFMTHMTLYLELFGPLLLLLPVFGGLIREWVVWVFICFHIGLGLCLSVGLFSYVCVVGLIAFLPNRFWDRLEAIGIFQQIAERMASLCRAFLTTPPVPDESIFRDAIAQPLFVKGIGIAHRLSALPPVLALCFVLWSCVNQLNESLKIPNEVKGVAVALGLTQNWAMFTEVEPSQDWFVFPGQLKDGRVVNLMTQETIIAYEKPRVGSATFKNFRWRRFCYKMRKSAYRSVRDPLGRYLRHSWDNNHSGDEVLLRSAIYYLSYPPSSNARDVDRNETPLPNNRTKLYSWTKTKKLPAFANSPVSFAPEISKVP